MYKVDLVSHGLLGSIIAGLSFGKKYRLLGYVATIVGSVAHDFDIITFLKGPKAFYKYHREITHSLLGTVVLGLLISIGVRLFTPVHDWATVFAMVGAGLLSHLAMDILTPWGLPLFYPFKSKKYSLDLIWFFDPVVISGLVAGVYLGYQVPENSAFSYLASFAVVISYLAYRVRQKRKARKIVLEELGPDKGAAVFVLPSAVSPFLWDVIVKERNRYIHFCVDTRRKEILSKEEFCSGAFHRCVKSSRDSDYVDIFLKRSRFPFYNVTRKADQTYTVEWSDVHLANLGGVHGVVVQLDGNGEIIEEKLQIKKPVRRKKKSGAV